MSDTATLTDTTTDGRIDIVIFTNGGKEVLGRIASEPKLSESVYMPSVKEFVAANVPESEPVQYTGYYSVKDGVLSFTWGEYEGEIVKEETDEEGVDDVAEEVVE